jgi:hypothetical protein
MRFPVCVVVVVSVGFAGLRGGAELAIEVVHGELLDAVAHASGMHMDAVLGEDFQRPASDPSNNDRLHPLFAKPQWEPARLMRRGCHKLRIENHSPFGFSVDEGIFRTPAEMPVQLTVSHRDGDPDGGFPGIMLGWHIVLFPLASRVPVRGGAASGAGGA